MASLRPLVMPDEPIVARSPTGVLVAALGSASDNADAELAQVLADLTRALAEPPRMIEVATPANPFQARALFESGDVPTTRTAAPLIWCFHAGAIASVMTSPQRRAALLDRMRRITDRGQLASLVGPATPALRAFADIAVGLGVGVQEPAEQHVVHVEVDRGDGRVISAIGGVERRDVVAATRHAPGSLRGQSDAAFAALVREIDVAEQAIAYRSPKLARLLETNPDTATIARELMSRGLPVFALRDGDGTLVRRDLGGTHVLPIYGDATAVQYAAEDLGRATPGALEFASAVKLAAAAKVGIGVGVYRDRKAPSYAVLPASFVTTI